MLRQAEFYAKMSALGGRSQVISRFRQVGDIVEAGFLPKNSAGTCSYTTLDFHRAVSQGCGNEWIEEAGNSKKSSSIWQSTFGTKGTSFGARQQLNFVSPEHTAKDVLFLRSLPTDKKQSVTANTISTSRHERVKQDAFAPNNIAEKVNILLREDPQASIRLNFDVIDNAGKNYGHTIAICPSQDGRTLYVMDPNVGVIATNNDELKNVLESLRSSLYKDYTLGETTLEIQDKFWLDVTNPLTDDDIEMFKEEEQVLLTRFTQDDYAAYRVAQMAFMETAVDCDFDENIEEQDEEEAVFKEEWDDFEEVEVPATAVRVGAKEYQSNLQVMRATESHAKAAANTNDGWDVINEDEEPKSTLTPK